MLTPREEYDQKWRAEPRRKPPTDPRGAHHRAGEDGLPPPKPRPDLQALCDYADSRGLTVEIDVGNAVINVGPDARRRFLDSLNLVCAGRTIASMPAGGDIDRAARALLERIG